MKNKIITAITIAFALFFLMFIVKQTDDFSKAKSNILNSQNVSEVGDLITTRMLISHKNFSFNDSWTRESFNDLEWTPIKIPFFKIVQDKDFKEGNFVYYRIKVPEKSFRKISHLKDETSILLHSIYLSRFDISINGVFFQSYEPVKTGEEIVILPIKEGVDNLIAIKGFIKTGDTGIDSRNKIIIGKNIELNAVHKADFKSQVAFQLVFILCKGSILFIFALIYLLLNVDSSFEKFFIFGLCTLIEELIAGDYLYGPLNFNQMVYLYNAVNVGGAIALFLFLGQFTATFYKKRLVIFFGLLLAIVSTSLAIDALYWNQLVSISDFMKFWNLFTVTILIFYLNKVFRVNKVLSFGLLITSSLYIWGALFAKNIGLNFKAYGNLLLFFMVAYETFAIFRREQEKLRNNEKQLLEQEKDVAIGKTASLLAHDVRKPLDQMKLVIEKISTGDVSPDFLELARKDIDISIASVETQVNDIMNFTKASKLNFVDVSFYRMLSHSLKQVMAIHQEMDIEIDYNLKANYMIKGDQSRLSNVLVNLIANAVEAIRDLGNRFKGNIVFESSIEGEYFVFKIFNDGPEIPENIKNEIFKPLFTFGKAGGTGLGLASVIKAIHEHNGNIFVENIIGKGVQFVLRFHKSNEPDNASSYSLKTNSILYQYISTSSPLKKEENVCFRVLILDKDELKIKQLKEILSKSSYDLSIQLFADIKEANEALKKNRYDFYILNDSCGGTDLFERELSFLSHEVVIYNHDINKSLQSSLKCLQLSWDQILEKLVDVFERALESRSRILFVDDTKLFRIAWQMFHGTHNIQCASTPEEALSLIRERKPTFDFFVIDYHFSNSSMNGVSLGQKIQEWIPGAKIIISSSVDLDDVQFKSISKKDYEVRKFI